MFFRNLTIYRLPVGWAMPAGTLEEILAKFPLQPCSGMSTTSRGWVSPRGDQQLVASHGKQLLIALGVEQKILPSAVINQTALDRALKLEKQQGYKVGKKQMRELKEQIMAELLPRAFSQRRSTRAWLSPADGWLVVDTASVGRAEEVTEQLRNVLGEFPISLPETKLSPVTVMSAWLAGNDTPSRFIIDQDCELRGADESKPTVRYVRHDLGGKDVAKHISDGKTATKLGLIWNERISFVLDGHLQLKKIRFLDIDKNRESDKSQNPEEQFEADFALMTGELSRLLADLLNQF
ncbi:MAG: recombination-associated protein RdgC [Pseudomonadota bacterium]